MIEFSKGSISIEGSASHILEILIDVENYPQWAAAIKSVEVLSRDAENRVISAEMMVDAGVMKDRIILDFNWSALPDQLSFTLQEGDQLQEMNGLYTLSSEGDLATKVDYQLILAISLPIPAFMIRKVEMSIVDQSLRQLKDEVEK